MKRTLSTSEIADALRADQYARWSYAGARALAEYLEEYEESTGEEMELDVVAIRCDFSEHSSALDCIADCGHDFQPDEDEDEDEREGSAREWLRERTSLLEFDGGIIIQAF